MGRIARMGEGCDSLRRDSSLIAGPKAILPFGLSCLRPVLSRAHPADPACPALLALPA
jgi:hypothetical protein